MADADARRRVARETLAFADALASPMTHAVLPIKRFGPRSSASAPSAGERRELAEAMVGDVLEALGGVEGLMGVIVVSGEPAPRGLADAAGAALDPDEAGQCAATLLGIERAAAPAAIASCSSPATARRSTQPSSPSCWRLPTPSSCVPDRHGSGTNALLLSPPDAIVPAFGPDSRARQRRSPRAGHERRIGRRSLELDVDTAGDLAALRAALARAPRRRPRTRAVVDRLVRMRL